MQKQDCIPCQRSASAASRPMGKRVLLSMTLLCAAMAGFGSTAQAQETPDARYRREVAACDNGSSNQDRATCLKEAGAAREEARKNHLTDGHGELQSNAMDRCKALPAADQDACMQRIEGQGITEGSVGGGGILRELVVPDTPK